MSMLTQSAQLAWLLVRDLTSSNYDRILVR